MLMFTWTCDRSSKLDVSVSAGDLLQIDGTLDESVLIGDKFLPPTRTKRYNLKKRGITLSSFMSYQRCWWWCQINETVEHGGMHACLIISNSPAVRSSQSVIPVGISFTNSIVGLLGTSLSSKNFHLKVRTNHLLNPMICSSRIIIKEWTLEVQDCPSNHFILEMLAWQLPYLYTYCMSKIFEPEPGGWPTDRKHGHRWQTTAGQDKKVSLNSIVMSKIFIITSYYIFSSAADAKRYSEGSSEDLIWSTKLI